jgi:ectoine hydroxylase-related dioxygenase (phytanoyl-CoA dioxygenase family)
MSETRTDTDFDRDGYAIARDVLSTATIAKLSIALQRAEITASRRGGEAYGGRNLLAVPEIRHVSRSTELRDLIEPHLGSDFVAVRGIFFDKTQQANWPVLWHQDLSLALDERADVPDWEGWSMKAGVVHAHPPVPILERMMTLRLHLDDCGADKGPLRVLPGSHRHGRLSRERIASLRACVAEEICCAPLGSVLMMRPLLLHASSSAEKPGHRRVVHLEYAPTNLLPPPLRWAFL